MGTVTSLEGGILRVRLEGTKGPRTFSVDPKSYKHLDHGYAMTVHKAQGVTVDRAFVLASSHFDRHTSYVALTRHRETVQLHYSKEELGTFEALCQTLSRTRLKDMALDHLGRPIAARASDSEMKPGTDLMKLFNLDPQVLAQVKAARLRAEAYASCQSRIDAYEQAQKRLSWEQSSLERAQPSSLEGIKENDAQYVSAKYGIHRAQKELERVEKNAARQHLIEAADRKARPIRTRWGLEGPRTSWNQFWRKQAEDQKVAEARMGEAVRISEALLHDPKWQRECTQKTETEQKRLEARLDKVAEQTNKLMRQIPQYEQDKHDIIKMQNGHQGQEKR